MITRIDIERAVKLAGGQLKHGSSDTWVYLPRALPWRLAQRRARYGESARR